MGRKINPILVPDNLDRRTLVHIVDAAYTAYIGTGRGRLPTIDEIHEYTTAVGKEKIAKYLSTAEFVAAVKQRGVPWDEMGGLSSKQMMAIAVMTDPTNKKPPAAKLKSVGVEYGEYRAWLRQPTFSNYVKNVTEQMVGDHIADMQVALTNKAMGGDLNAIKFVYEMTGKYDPASREVIQLQAVIRMLLEVLSRHLATQPELMQSIAKDIQTAIPIMGEVL